MERNNDNLSSRKQGLVKHLLINSILLLHITTAAAQVAELSANKIIDDGVRVAETDLYLDVTVNGTHIGLVHMGYGAGKLWTNANTLQQMGIRPPTTATTQPICLNSIAELTLHYSVEAQTLALTVPLTLLQRPTTRLSPLPITRPTVTAAPGLLLNYDIYGSVGQDTQVNSFSEFRLFNTRGVLTSTQLTQFSKNSVITAGNRRFIRLDSRWRTPFPESMITFTLGDLLTRSLTWSRATRLAGLQISKDFSLQPYRTTVPLPAFLGSVALPSQVDVYINNVKHFSGEVPAGNFELNTLPTISGAGKAQLLITDTLGRTTVQHFAFYNDRNLLQRGLSSWSAELGVVRKNYGLTAFDYGKQPIFSGLFQHGITNNLTAGMHTEVGDKVINAGVSTDWLPGIRSGVITTALAFSAAPGGRGLLHELDYRWTGEQFNLGLSAQSTTEQYQDVAARYGAPMTKFSANAVLGYNFTRWGNVSLNYFYNHYPQMAAARLAGVNWFKSLSESLNINAGINKNLGSDNETLFFFTLMFTLDGRYTMSATLEENAGAAYLLNASKSLPQEHGWGWSATLGRQGQQWNGQWEQDYLGRYGKAYAGFSRMMQQEVGYAGASGSLVALGGGIFASRQIDRSFAVVSTSGVPNIPVKLENNLVGYSDQRGLLLVAPLNAYQQNKLSIDASDLMANMHAKQISVSATPSMRAGTVVTFPIETVRAVSLNLVDKAGVPIAHGSRVDLMSDPSWHAVIGYDGALFLKLRQPHNRFRVNTPTGICYFDINYLWRPENIVHLERVICDK